MHGAKTTAVHEFTEEEMLAEGRIPVPEDRKEKPSEKGTLDFYRYIPWYLRREFMLMRLAKELQTTPDILAQSKRYDEIIELRWLYSSEQKALGDQRG